MWLHRTIIGLSALILIIVTRVQATEVKSEAQTNTQANSSAAATANDASNNDESDNPAVPVIAKDDIERNTDNLTDVKEPAETAKSSAVLKNDAAATESDSVTENSEKETTNSSVSKDSIKEVKPDAAAAGGSSSTYESSTSNPTTSGSDTTSMEQDGVSRDPTDLFDGGGNVLGNSGPQADSAGAAGFGGPIYGNGFFPDFNFHNYGNSGPDDMFINSDSLFYDVLNQDSLLIGAASQFQRIDKVLRGTGPGVASSNTGSWSGSSSQSNSNSDGGGSTRTSSFGISSRSGENDENSPGNGVKGIYSSTSLDIDSSGKGVYKVSAGKIH